MTRNLRIALFTSASLLFLFSSPIQVSANDNFDCPWGSAISFLSYDETTLTTSCTAVTGLVGGNGTCGGNWAAAPDGSQPACNKCMSADGSLRIVDVLCPPGQIATGFFADSSTGCQTYGIMLDCSPLPFGWSFGGTTQVLNGVRAAHASPIDIYTPYYTNIQPPVPTCDNDNLCESGETCGNCPNDCCQPTCSLTVSPTSGPNPTTVTYTWGSTFDDDGQIPYSCTFGPSSGILPTASGSSSFSVGTSGSCTVTAANSVGSIDCTAAFTLAGSPTCSINGPGSVIVGTPFNVSWSSTDAITVQSFGWSGPVTPAPGPSPNIGLAGTWAGLQLTGPGTAGVSLRANGSVSSGFCSYSVSDVPTCNRNGICENPPENCALCPTGDDCCPIIPLPTCNLTFNPISGAIGQSVDFDWTQTGDQDNSIPMFCNNGGPNTPRSGTSGFGTFTATRTGFCRLTVRNATGTNTCTANFTATCNGPLPFPAWVDPVLTDGAQIPPPPPTQIRTIHFTQIQARINTLRVDAGLPPFNWAVCGFNPVTNTRISRRLINCPRTALKQVYAACLQPVPPGILGSVLQNTPIRKQHVIDLRIAIDLAK